MNEWGYLLATFWGFWLVDGLRLARTRSWSFTGGHVPGKFGLRYGTWHALPPSPDTWRAMTPEVPFALSPDGICNRPVAGAGRPVEGPRVASACRWEEIRDVSSGGGWITINGRRFCRDTGHAKVDQLRELAALPRPERPAAVRRLLAGWMRPLALRRKAKLVRARTGFCVAVNTTGLGAMLLLTLYLVLAPTGVWEDETVARFSELVVPVAVLVLAAHVAGIVLARRALRHCPPVRPLRPDTRLLSAALFPPQALRLRALVAEGYFPAQHPLAFALAFATPAQRRQAAFDTLADLHWPVGESDDPAGAREVTAWCRQQWREILEVSLLGAGLSPESLLAPPSPVGREACRYCPRCGDQFVTGAARCGHGIPLRPLPRTPVTDKA